MSGTINLIRLAHQSLEVFILSWNMSNYMSRKNNEILWIAIKETHVKSS
jgi:hypothetical protein